MSAEDERARYAVVTAAARVFALLVLAPSVILAGTSSAILGVSLVAAVWMVAVLAEGMRSVPPMPALVTEASLVTLLAALTLVDSVSLLPALVIPTFVGGLTRGARGALEVLGAELAVLAATILPNSDISKSGPLAIVLFTWLMAGLGFGLLASVVRSARLASGQAVTPYRDARRLISKLLDLSGELVDGLDPVSISENIIDLAREELPLANAVVFIRDERGVTPLLGSGVTTSDAVTSELVLSVFSSSASARRGDRVAIPLQVDANVVAVLGGTLSRSGASAIAEEQLNSVATGLRTEALQLDTALLFSAVRDEATAEERRRIARDLHDGVAQDLASLGYLIDDLAATAEDERQAQRCLALREQLTSVVADLRRSVFSLRNEAGAAASLGASIQAMATHLESRFGVPVDVTLHEGEARLRPDVESELLRIAQEAMNNAMKHARATRLAVVCTVNAPDAELTVHDDGRGLQPGREDSHGLRIMRERARRIGASFELASTATRSGTVLRIVLNASARSGRSPDRLEGMVTP